MFSITVASSMTVNSNGLGLTICEGNNQYFLYKGREKRGRYQMSCCVFMVVVLCRFSKLNFSSEACWSTMNISSPLLAMMNPKLNWPTTRILSKSAFLNTLRSSSSAAALSSCKPDWNRLPSRPLSFPFSQSSDSSSWLSRITIGFPCRLLFCFNFALLIISSMPISITTSVHSY